MGETTATPELGARLTDLKQRSGRTYESLARRLGVSRSALHRYCQGDSVPTQFAVLEEFARQCGGSRSEIDELREGWNACVARPHPGISPSSDALLVMDEPARGLEPGHGAEPGHGSELVVGPGQGSPGWALNHRPRLGRWVIAGLTSVTVVAVIVAVMVVLRTPSGGAAPASTGTATVAPCSLRLQVHHEDKQLGGAEWTSDHLCANKVEASVYLTPTALTEIAVLDTPMSWFVCWTVGRPQRDGGRVWYYTRGDRAQPGEARWQGWGFVAAQDVQTTMHPWPTMPQCRFSLQSRQDPADR
jgi:hypothetical protein